MYTGLFETANLQSCQSSSASSYGKPSSQQEKQEINCYNPHVLLANAKLEPDCTGDGVTSSEWVKDFRAESLVMGSLHPYMFFPDNTSTTWTGASDDCSDPAEGCKPAHTDAAVHISPIKTAAANKTNLSPSLSNVKKKRIRIKKKQLRVLNESRLSPSSPNVKKKRIRIKKKQLRVLDESRSVEQTEYDIIFGRGHFATRHPGNIYFRQKALELLPSYILSAKEEKQGIAKELIESIKSEGRRFLEKGKDDLWYEVVDGVFSKASQVFRDLKSTG